MCFQEGTEEMVMKRAAVSGSFWGKSFVWGELMYIKARYISIRELFVVLTLLLATVHTAMEFNSHLIILVFSVEMFCFAFFFLYLPENIFVLNDAVTVQDNNKKK